MDIHHLPPIKRAVTTLLFCLCLIASSPSLAFLDNQTNHIVSNWTLPASEQARPLEQILSLPHTAWQPGAPGVLNLSFDKREHWLKIRLQNTAPATRELILVIDQPIQDYIDFWQINPSGSKNADPVSHYQTGDLRPFHNRPIQYRGFAFPVQLSPGKETEVYLRIDTYDGLYEALPMRLYDREAFYSHLTQDALWYGIYYGCLLILIAYNLIIGTITREKDFFLYALYLLNFFLWNFSFRGYSYYYLWPTAPQWAHTVIALTSINIFITLTFFTISFLRLRQHNKWGTRLLLLLTFLHIPPLLLAFAGHYASAFQVLIPVSSLLLISILYVGGHQACRGSRPAKVFSLAWFILIVSALIYYLQVSGLVSPNWLSSNILNIGSLIEILVLALAMVDKINHLKHQQAIALKKNLALQQERSIDLEEKVKEKTQQLLQLNEQLARDSVTDALTGLLNRRKLDSLYQERISKCALKQEYIAFAMIDLDHFKQINDTYGHQDGDNVLMSLAKQMQNYWQNWSADLFRFGGEEFGIIVCHSSKSALLTALKTFQQSIETAELHEHRQITASSGAIIMPAQQPISLDQAIQQADELLYKAKHQGRNLFLYQETQPETHSTLT